MRNILYLTVLMLILSHYSAESAVPKFDYGDVPDFKIAHIKSNWFKCKNSKIINYEILYSDKSVYYYVKFYNCLCDDFIELTEETDIKGSESE